MTDIESIFMRITDKNESNYEALFSFLEIPQSIYYWFLNKKNYNQFLFKYNEDKTKLYFYFNVINKNTRIVERRALILNLKSNKDDLLIINNEKKIKLLNKFNNQYSSFIRTDETTILLPNKRLNNQGLKDLSELGLNPINLYLDNNRISDLSPLMLISFKNLKKLYLSSNNINDINCFVNLKFENLLELNLSSNKINDISALENAKMSKLKVLLLAI